MHNIAHMTIGAVEPIRPDWAYLLTCEFPVFAAVVLAVLPTVEQRFGDRKVFISGLHATLVASGCTISLDAFKLRLLSARAAGLIELARADLVAAMPAELVRDSSTIDLGAEYHFVVDRSARDPWMVDAAPVVDRISGFGAAS